MAVLITGVAGLTGSYLLTECLDKGQVVVGVDNLFRGTQKNLDDAIKDSKTIKNPHSFTFLYEDITDKKFYERLERVNKNLKDSGDCITEIYHLAAIVPTKYFYERPELTYKVNCQGTIDLFNWAMANGVKKFVNASSSEIYGHPQETPTKETTPTHYDAVEITPRWSYAQGKILTEHVLNYYKDKIEVCHLRYANVYGPRDIDDNHVLPYILQRMINNEDLVINRDSDTIRRTFLYMSDCADATFLAMQNMKNGTSYNIGSQEEVTISELVSLCSEVLSEVFQIEYTSKFDFSLNREGDPVRRVLDTTRAKEQLGFNTKVSLAEGIKITAKWIINSKLDGSIK